MIMSADNTPFSYYGDINPRYGAKREKRYVVWLRRSRTNSSPLGYEHQYTKLAYAERAADRLNKQEADPAL